MADAAGAGSWPEAVGTLHYADDANRMVARYGLVFMVGFVVEAKGQFAGAVRLRAEGSTVGSIPHDLSPT